MKYDGILIALYILALVVIVVELFSMVALTVVIVLLIVMIAVQKVGLEKTVKSIENERNKRLDDILAKIEDVSKKTDNFKEDFNRQVVFVDNKVAEVRHFVETEMQNFYAELSRKMSEIEYKLDDAKQTLAAAVGSLDERLRGIESEEEPAEEGF